MAGRNVTTVVADLVRTLPADPRLDDVVAAVARTVGTPTRVVDVDGPSWGSLTALVSQAPHENLVLVPAAVPPHPLARARRSPVHALQVDPFSRDACRTT